MVSESGARQAAQMLVEGDVPGFNAKKPVRFKSRIYSPFYADCRKMQSWPNGRDILHHLFALRAQHLRFAVVAGIQNAAIPWSYDLAQRRGMPHVSIRKEDKTKEGGGHGLAGLIEGVIPPQSDIILVEDMVSMATSVGHGVRVLRDAGHRVSECVCIMAYDFPWVNDEFVGTNAELEALDLTLFPLTTFEHVLNAMIEAGKLTESERDYCLQWRQDPNLWYGRWQDGYRPAAAS